MTHDPMADLPTTDRITRRRLLRNAGAAGLSLSAVGAFGVPGALASRTVGQQKKRVITFWKGPHHADDLKFQKEFAAEFHKLHPDITVNASVYNWATVDTQLTAAYASDTPPDVAYLVTRIWARFAEEGKLVDLTPFVKAPKFRSEYNAYTKKTWASVTYKGKIWGVPVYGAVFPVFANLDLLKKAGVAKWNASLATMRAAAKKTTSGNVFGFSIGTELPEEPFHYLQSYIHNGGGTLFSEDLRSGGLDKPGVVKAMDVLRAIFVDDKSAPAPGLYDAEGKVALFQAGRIAILHANPDTAARMYVKPPGFKWAMFFGPPGPAGQTMAGDFGYYCIAAKSKDVNAAWEYDKFLTSRAVVSKQLQNVEWVVQPVRTDIPKSVLAKAPPYVPQLITDFVPKVVAFTAHPRQLDALKVLTEEWGLLARGKKTADKMVKDANARITKIARSS